jgi:seryl-tRNA synthetase
MDGKVIRLAQRRKRIRQEIEASMTPNERAMDRKIEILLEQIDDLKDRVETLESRQLQLVRALNELLSRLEEQK